jgi:uracil-DNA glycosylase family 4
VPTAEQRRAALRGCSDRARACTRCPALVESRTQVVFGTGDPDADLVFVGEAPGREEDRDGAPLVGRAARLLDELLATIGVARTDVFVCTLVRCRPPDNRDPTPVEIESCREWLIGTLEAVAPRVVCPLGNVATKLLRGDPAPITQVHGCAEVHALGPRTVRLYPLFHPASALYHRASVDLLRADVARLPDLLALPLPEQATAEGTTVRQPAEPTGVAVAAPAPDEPSVGEGLPGGDEPPEQLTLL